MKDVIIIGMGIAGISASIYAKQANKDVLCFEGKMIGGLLNNIDKISNYAGLEDISGPDFASKLVSQVKSLDIDVKSEVVTSIKEEDEFVIVSTNNGEYKAKNVVIATGRRPKLLGLDNEEKLLGSGVSTCALCDGFFFKNKDVAVVGAGNSALQEALYLSNVVNKVYLVVRRNKIIGSSNLVDDVTKCSNIEVLLEERIESFNEENDILKDVTLSSGRLLDVKGVFVYAGYEPDTDFLIGSSILNQHNYVEVDENLRTSMRRVFGIGDVTRKDIYQLISAASDGARVVNKLNR